MQDRQDATKRRNGGPGAGRLRLDDIARALGLEAVGDGTLRVGSLAEPGEAGPEDLALALDAKYAAALRSGQARAAILWAGADWRELGLEGAILATRAGAVLPGVTALMDPGPGLEPGLHPAAVIDATARIGADAWIGACAVIGPGVEIGPGARIAPHVSIAPGARIGARALLHAGVRIGRRVRIGDDFIAQPGAVIGGDGFSFKTPDRASVVERLSAELSGAAGDGGDGGQPGSAHWARVASLGGVEIGDNVEIGANSTIDRGTIRATRIGAGTKIDNLVQIGHNVIIGRDCMISAASGIAGSARLGDRVVLGGMCGLRDNIRVGDDVIAGGRSAIFSDVPAGQRVWGDPAVPMKTRIAINRELRRLPKLAARIRAALEVLAAPGQEDGAPGERRGERREK